MILVSRILVGLVAVLFAVIGIEFWVVPEQAAQQFGIEAVRGLGLVNLRADLGGLFLGLALLCGAGAWTKRRAGLIAAAVILAAVIGGRAAGWLVDGGVGIGSRELALELGALVALVLYARSLGAPSDPVPAHETHKPLKIALAALAVLIVASAAALLTPAVQQSIFDKAAMQLSARTNTAPLVDDALRVAIAGSSAPLPSASRAKASVVVFAGGKFWVVDSGPESVENLVLWGIPLSKIGGVLITHFHSDHIGDLGELQLQTWAGGREKPLAVYGGPGVDSLVGGFNMAYRLDQGYRTAHHGEKVMPSAAWGMTAHTVTLDGAPTPAKDRTGLVLEDGDLRITAIEVDHAPIEPAYAYRFDYKGRSVVVSGDLKYHAPLIQSAAGADILVSEAISRSMTKSLESAAHSVGRGRTEAIMHDVQDYHISPEEAARLANDASVKLLVYYHLLPAPDGFLARRLFANGVNGVRRGDWTIADDGSLYTLPLGSEEVRIGKM
ncbi:MAG TPA: MBL fold metallo-hydrolase [Candidatus Eisenbacteria bacterium]|nr:MBL fold metallo-hydrolase [Candidatus Eisenbacteria bacterium]